MTIRKFFDTDTLQLLVYELDDTLFLTFDYDDIIKESITCTDTLMNGINSGSCSISLAVKDSYKVDNLLAHNSELKATLKANGIVAFKGYLSNKNSLSINSYGIPSVSLSLEDIGTKLFKKELYPDSLVDHYFSGTLEDFVKLIKTQLGGSLEYSPDELESETRVISSTIKSNATIESLLKQACLELGYVYYFNAGVLTFFRIPVDATASETVKSFALNGTSAVNISREIRKYKTARVQTDVYENASNILIYRDNSGTSDSEGCEVEIKAGEHYPAISDTGEPAEYTAEDIESGKEIISISNLRPNVSYEGGTLDQDFAINGAKTITVDLHNTSTVASNVKRLECRGDVIRVASTEVVKTSIATSSQESDNVYEVSCSWIHDKEKCEALARTLGSYFNYCDTQYTFYIRDTDTSFTSSPFRSGLVGKVVNLKEETISSLDVNVLVVKATYNTSAGYIQYNAVGYSKFNMVAPIIHTSVKSSNSSYIGPTGAGTKAYLTKSDQSDSWWEVNCKVGSSTTFADSSSYRSDCRKNDFFIVVGTSTEGKAHTAIFKSLTEVGDLMGTCMSHVYADKGGDGEKGASVVSTEECALSTGSSLTEEEQASLSWTDESSLGWSYGYYIYRRTMFTTLDTGEVSYKYYGRDENLENYYNNLLFFSVEAGSYSYPINERESESTKTAITLTVDDRYYGCDSFNWSFSDSTIEAPTKVAEGIYTISLPVKGAASSYTITVTPSKNGTTLSQIERTLVLKGVDETESSIFFGAVSSLTNVGLGKVLLNGDGCFLTQDDGDNKGNLVYVYQDGSWVEFNECTLEADKKTIILSKAQQVAVEYANQDGNVLSSSYAYLGTLIANYIGAESIGAETIVLTGDNGKLVGGDYTTKDGDFLANKGVYLDSEGTALFNDAKLKNCTISSGTITDITIKGVVDNAVLTTTLEDVAADTISITGNYSSNQAYIGSEALSYINNLLTSGTVYSYSGSATSGSTTTSYSKIVRIDTEKLISGISSSVTQLDTGYCDDYVAVDENRLFMWINSVPMASTDGGSSWFYASDAVSRFTQRSYDPYSTGLKITNIGSISIGKINGYTTVVSECDYSTTGSPTDWQLISFSYDSSGNLVDTDRSPVSKDGDYTGKDTSRPTMIGGTLCGISRVICCGDTYVDFREWYKNGSYYIYMTAGIPTSSTSTYPYRVSSSNYVGADHCYGPFSSYTFLPYSVGWNDKWIVSPIPGDDGTTGKYIITPRYSIAGSNYGKTWTTVSGYWPSTKNTSRFLQFFTLDDNSGKVFAVSSPSSFKSSGDFSYLFYSDDPSSSNSWKFCVGALSLNRYVRPLYWRGMYIFGDYMSRDLKTWSYQSGLDERYIVDKPSCVGDYIYSRGNTFTNASSNKMYRTKLTPSYYPQGINFLDSKGTLLLQGTALASSLTTNTLTMNNGSTSLLNLPTTIPSSLNTYRKMESVFAENKTLYSVANAKCSSYTRWDSSSNKDVTVSSYNGTPNAVSISPTSFVIDGKEYLNSGWWIKNNTTIVGEVTPNAAVKGLTTEDLNPKNADTSIGNITPYNTIRGNYIYGSSGNDLADCINVSEDMEVECGYCYCFDGTNYYKSTEYMDKKLIGVHTDTAGFYLGSSFDKKQLKIAVAGFVLAYVDKEYEIGTPLTCTSNGYLTEIKQEDKINYPERVVAVYWKPEPNEKWGRVDVNGRQWVRIR